jgi:hypothetical protein
VRYVPIIAATIERRLLVNYRVDPDALERVLPAGFRPHLVNGVGVAGICLIRLGHLRPVGLPAVVGLTTENAAHRVAVEWDGPDGPHHGVFIPRRDTSSLLTTMIGGRIFPGEHHRARFQVRESKERYEVAFESLDRSAMAAVDLRAVQDWPVGSVFSSLAEASSFFEESPLGLSPTRRVGDYDGVELCCRSWDVAPLVIESAESSFFGNRGVFPGSAVELDSAILMRSIPVTWKWRTGLTLPTGSVPQSAPADSGSR